MNKKVITIEDMKKVELDKDKGKSKTFYYAVGRRKSSIARVRIHKKGDAQIVINDKPLEEYFKSLFLKKIVHAPLEATSMLKGAHVTIRVVGGGPKGQADSIKLGIARALLLLNPELRQVLKKAGHLKRDPRVKERKKYGLKRARRAPQWSKR